MGLDVYVGSLTRYFTRDWETVVQKMGREEGAPVRVIRAHDPRDAITDPDEVRSLVLHWRAIVSASLGENLDAPLEWSEGPDTPYFTDKPSWDPYLSLTVWAAYSEHEDLQCPFEYVEDLAEDEALARSSDPEFGTDYTQLVSGIEWWLPIPGPRVFIGPSPTGKAITFGASPVLRSELAHLNSKTWNASEAQIQEWRREGAGHKCPTEAGAKFAFAVLWELSGKAVDHRLPMLLDY